MLTHSNHSELVTALKQQQGLYFLSQSADVVMRDNYIMHTGALELQPDQFSLSVLDLAHVAKELYQN